jgi:hypothetical protein
VWHRPDRKPEEADHAVLVVGEDAAPLRERPLDLLERQIRAVSERRRIDGLAFGE